MANKRQRKEINRKREKAKYQVATSTPQFNPRESWSSRQKVGGVPVSILDEKEHHFRNSSWYTRWF